MPRAGLSWPRRSSPAEVRDDLTLEQITDMINAIAKIPADPAYLKPMFETLLQGLHPPGTAAQQPAT